MPVTDNSDSLVTRNLTVQDSLELGDDTAIEFQEMAAPPTPAEGAVLLYAKSDGKLYAKDDAGTESDLTAASKTVTKIVYIENPAASDSFPVCYAVGAASMVAVRAVTDTGTVDFNIEKRGKFTPDQAGTDVWSAGGEGELQAVAAGVERTAFDSGVIAADTWLNFNASAVAGSPTQLWVAIEYAID